MKFLVEVTLCGRSETRMQMRQKVVRQELENNRSKRGENGTMHADAPKRRVIYSLIVNRW